MKAEILNYLKTAGYRKGTTRIAKVVGADKSATLRALRQLAKEKKIIRYQDKPGFWGGTEAEWLYYDAEKWG